MGGVTDLDKSFHAYKIVISCVSVCACVSECMCDLQSFLKGADREQGQVLLLFSISYKIHVNQLLDLGRNK